jgi:hypothetical protein
MVSPKPFIRAPLHADEKSFEIGDTLTVFEAAMVYAGRHPHSRFLRDGSIEDRLTFLRAGIREREPRVRIRARVSWDILCELVKRIEHGRLNAVRPAYSKDGQIDPIRTVIRTADLVALAIERGNQPKYLRHLLERGTSIGRGKPLAERGAQKFAAEYITREKRAGRRPTMAGLERLAREAKLRGGREFLREAFRRVQGADVRVGRPRTKFAKK